MMDDLKIIKVSTEKELRDCLDIRRSVFIEEQNVDKKIEVDRFENDAIHFLATINNEKAGCGRFRKYNNYMKFERIAILLPYRKKGIGKSLMNFMQKIALKEHPNHTCYMHAQFEAVPFYEKLGWKKTGSPFLEADIKHVAMIY